MFDRFKAVNLDLLASEVRNQNFLIGKVEILIVGNNIPDVCEVGGQSISREIALVVEVLEDEIILG